MLVNITSFVTPASLLSGYDIDFQTLVITLDNHNGKHSHVMFHGQ